MNQTDRTVDTRPTGRYSSLMKQTTSKLQDMLLDATETVVARQGIANLTLDAVAAEARMSKGGLLHYFPSKDRLVEALVIRTAEGWRSCYTEAYERTPEGPGRMARALLDHCLSDAKCWTEELRRSSSAVFAALAQNPALIQPMRGVYADLHRRIAQDGLPPGVPKQLPPRSMDSGSTGCWDSFHSSKSASFGYAVRLRTCLHTRHRIAVHPRPSVRRGSVQEGVAYESS